MPWMRLTGRNTTTSLRIISTMHFVADFDLNRLVFNAPPLMPIYVFIYKVILGFIFNFKCFLTTILRIFSDVYNFIYTRCDDQHMMIILL